MPKYGVKLRHGYMTSACPNMELSSDMTMTSACPNMELAQTWLWLQHAACPNMEFIWEANSVHLPCASKRCSVLLVINTGKGCPHANITIALQSAAWSTKLQMDYSTTETTLGFTHADLLFYCIDDQWNNKIKKNLNYIFFENSQKKQKQIKTMIFNLRYVIFCIFLISCDLTGPSVIDPWLVLQNYSTLAANIPFN